MRFEARSRASSPTVYINNAIDTFETLIIIYILPTLFDGFREPFNSLMVSRGSQENKVNEKHESGKAVYHSHAHGPNSKNLKESSS